jgi:homoserine O-succinyltransferase
MIIAAVSSIESVAISDKVLFDKRHSANYDKTNVPAHANNCKFSHLHSNFSEDEHDVFLMGHFEYATDTLEKEYLRDHERGINTLLFIDSRIS